MDCAKRYLIKLPRRIRNWYKTHGTASFNVKCITGRLCEPDKCSSPLPNNRHPKCLASSSPPSSHSFLSSLASPPLARPRPATTCICSSPAVHRRTIPDAKSTSFTPCATVRAMPHADMRMSSILRHLPPPTVRLLRTSTSPQEAFFANTRPNRLRLRRPRCAPRNFPDHRVRRKVP